MSMLGGRQRQLPNVAPRTQKSKLHSNMCQMETTLRSAGNWGCKLFVTVQCWQIYLNVANFVLFEASLIWSVIQYVWIVINLLYKVSKLIIHKEFTVEYRAKLYIWHLYVDGERLVLYYSYVCIRLQLSWVMMLISQRFTEVHWIDNRNRRFLKVEIIL